MNVLENCGIGSRTLAKLNNLGITTVKGLAFTHAYQLVDAGIGKTTANKILKSARKAYMDIHKFTNPYGKRFVMGGTNLQEATILGKIQKQLSYLNGSPYSVRSFYDFDTHLDHYIGVYNSKDEIGIGEYTDKKDKIYWNRGEFWGSFGGIFYKLDKGKVILLWYHPYYANAAFPILKKIPEDILELTHLKYSCILCTHKAIERMPKTIRSNDLFEVKIEPFDTSTPDYDQMINEVGSKFKIIRRGTLDGFDSGFDFLLEEAFIRKSL